MNCQSKQIANIVLTLCVVALWSYSSGASYALETSTAATTAGNSEFSLEPDPGEHSQERKEIENLLDTIENQWNEHNIEAVMGNYADDYINNDGLDKKAVTELTKDFWKTYPDAKSSSKTRQIRIDGNFATVESRDMAVGSTAKPWPGIGTKGDLSSISEGQLYIKKLGATWKIIGDRIDYEKVRVAYGLARDLDIGFSAPEQVKSGRHFSAKLELKLPTNLTAIGSITRQTLEYPQAQPSDSWRPLDGPVLERVMEANNDNRNELLLATVGITNAAHSSLMGIEFLTRRLNVVPNLDDTHAVKTAEKPATTSEAVVDNKVDNKAGNEDN
jgi:hypothetical protein